MKPGIYSMPAAAYHADPAPEASLSGSVAVPLVHRSPRHAWWAHPRLNSQAERVNSDKMDLGTVAHALLLGCGGEISVIDAENYTTKEARRERDAAREAGRTPILSGTYQEAEKMAKRAGEFLDNAVSDWLNGQPEQALIWQEGEAWCRGMVDWLMTDRRIVIDYKTTGTSARPDDVERHLFDMHYHLKAAFYERGLNVLHPEGVGRRRFLFLFQETDAPFECSLVQLSEGAMMIGRKQATYAIRRWQACMKSGVWPGYGLDAHTASPPPWIENRWMAREMSDPFATGETAPGEALAVYPVHGNSGF
jgi:hypothetical protein